MLSREDVKFFQHETTYGGVELKGLVELRSTMMVSRGSGPDSRMWAENLIREQIWRFIYGEVADELQEIRGELLLRLSYSEGTFSAMNRFDALLEKLRRAPTTRKEQACERR